MKQEDQPSSYYPIFMNIGNRECVVVGGGQVALRKVNSLLEHRASVKVISPEICPGLHRLAMDGKIKVIGKEYGKGDLKGALIVIAATDDREINHRVVEEARSNSILVNVVDDADNSDFILPSYMRRGDVTIAVSTAGRSPALARKIRTRLEEDFSAEYASLALLIDEVRTEVRRRGIKVDGDSWQEALDPDYLIGMLRTGDKEGARNTLLGNLQARQK